MTTSTDHLKSSTKRKMEKSFEEFMEAVGVFDQHDLSGNISLVAHFSKGQIMKADIGYYHGIKFK